MTYVNGFLAPVKNANREAYLQMARACVPVFKELGALRMVETWGADVPDGKLTSFPMAVKLEEDETVVFSWIVWPSKEVADAAMPKMIEDEQLKAWEDNMPFDGKRMVYGGFEVILDE